MRTKACEGVWRVDVARLDVKPELVILYDGLGGISHRRILEDLFDAISRMGRARYDGVISAIRARRAGTVYVYYTDYVSYGIGGGDATTEHLLGSFMLLHENATSDEPERLVLLRPGGAETFVLEDPDATVSSPPPSVEVGGRR